MRAIIILLIIALCAGCKQRQLVEDKQVVADTPHYDEENAPLLVCVYNNDSIIQKVPRGYLYIERKGVMPFNKFLLADSIELTIVAKGFHKCHSSCIYYDSITTINNPKLQKLKGEYIATVFTDDDNFREKVNHDKTLTGNGLQRTAKGKIIHARVQNDRYDHVGLVFIENNAQWPVN